MSIDPVAYEAAIAQRDRYSAQLEVARQTIRSLQNALADPDSLPYTLQACGHPWSDYNRDHGECMLCKAGEYRKERLADMAQAASSGSEREQAGEHLIDWHDLGAILSDEDYREWRGRILAAIAQASSEREQELTNALRRAVYLAQRLMQMISEEDWRATGGDDGQGHYEGDYHAAGIAQELRDLAALAPAVEEQR